MNEKYKNVTGNLDTVFCRNLLARITSWSSIRPRFLTIFTETALYCLQLPSVIRSIHKLYRSHIFPSVAATPLIKQLPRPYSYIQYKYTYLHIWFLYRSIYNIFFDNVIFCKYRNWNLWPMDPQHGYVCNSAYFDSFFVSLNTTDCFPAKLFFVIYEFPQVKNLSQFEDNNFY